MVSLLEQNSLMSPSLGKDNKSGSNFMEDDNLEGKLDPTRNVIYEEGDEGQAQRTTRPRDPNP